MLQRLFRLRGRGTSVRIEALDGATTFVTMACIFALAHPRALPVIAKRCKHVASTRFFALNASRAHSLEHHGDAEYGAP
jgi:xanthine/uracil/vitamin C permease (AzgA family)